MKRASRSRGGTRGALLRLLLSAPAVVAAGMASAQEPADERLPALFDAVAPAVVNVRQGASNGTGMIVDLRRGLILTAFHVVSSATLPIRVQFFPDRSEGGWVNGVERLKWDHAVLRDMALLQVEHLPEGVRAVTLGDDDAWPANETAVVIGFPGEGDSVIPWQARELKVGSVEVPQYPGFVPLNERLPRGFSGGPVIGQDGRVHGLLHANLNPDLKTCLAVGARLMRGFLLEKINELSAERGPRVELPELSASIEPPRTWRRLPAEAGGAAPDTVARFFDPEEGVLLSLARVPKALDGRLDSFGETERRTARRRFPNYEVLLEEEVTLPRKPVPTLLIVAGYRQGGAPGRRLVVAHDLGGALHVLSVEAPEPVFRERQALLEGVIMSYRWGPAAERERLYRTPEATARTLLRAIENRESDWFLSCFDLPAWTRREAGAEVFEALSPAEQQARIDAARAQLDAQRDALASEIGTALALERGAVSEREATVHLIKQEGPDRERAFALTLVRTDEGEWKVAAFTDPREARLRRAEAGDVVDRCWRACYEQDRAGFLALCDLRRMRRRLPAGGPGSFADEAALERALVAETFDRLVRLARDKNLRFFPEPDGDPQFAVFRGELRGGPPGERTPVRLVLERTLEGWRVVEIELPSSPP